MSVVLWGLLFAIALPIALAVMVLATPVKLGFTLRTSPRRRLTVAARLFGGLAPPIPIHDSTRRRRARAKPKPKKRAAIEAGPSRRRPGRAIAAAPRLLVDLLRPIHLDRLTVDADIGLADPADTGRLYGAFAALAFSRPATPAVSIAIRPDFTGARASGTVDAQLSFVPVAFIPPGVRFAWHVWGPHR